ncbi:hypothetical protein ACFLT7_03635 [candidate division KSB1 bacterium]
MIRFSPIGPVLLITAVLLGLTLPAATAQDLISSPDPLEPGASLRLTVRDPDMTRYLMSNLLLGSTTMLGNHGYRFQGTLSTLGRNNLTIQEKFLLRPLSIEFNSIEKMEISLGRVTGDATPLFAGIGFFTGFMGGLTYLLAGSIGPPDHIDRINYAKYPLGVGLVGMGLGALVGVFIPTEDWKTFPVPRGESKYNFRREP